MGNGVIREHRVGLVLARKYNVYIQWLDCKLVNYGKAEEIGEIQVDSLVTLEDGDASVCPNIFSAIFFLIF